MVIARPRSASARVSPGHATLAAPRAPKRLGAFPVPPRRPPRDRPAPLGPGHGPAPLTRANVGARSAPEPFARTAPPEPRPSPGSPDHEAKRGFRIPSPPCLRPGAGGYPPTGWRVLSGLGGGPGQTLIRRLCRKFVGFPHSAPSSGVGFQPHTGRHRPHLRTRQEPHRRCSLRSGPCVPQSSGLSTPPDAL